MQQVELFSDCPRNSASNIPPLLKWIGNKYRVAVEIISYFPSNYRTYYEPFLGSGAVLGALAPRQAVATDGLRPLGGVIRFRRDGYMSTPIGVHNPISPSAMAKRINIWHQITRGTRFVLNNFEETIDQARAGDLVYCDPPYYDTQSILYGAQEFSLERLFYAVQRAKRRGAFVALSIDGQKKSGKKKCQIPIPKELFKRVISINCGRSMLRRFQMEGKTLESEVVLDRLLLTW